MLIVIVSFSPLSSFVSFESIALFVHFALVVPSASFAPLVSLDLLGPLVPLVLEILFEPFESVTDFFLFVEIFMLLLRYIGSRSQSEPLSSIYSEMMCY